MTNKTIEEIEALKQELEISRSLLEDKTAEWISACKERNELQALREQAAQTTLPSRQDFYEWLGSLVRQKKGPPAYDDVYDWLRDNSKPKERPEATFAHIQKLAFEFAKEHHYGDQYTMFSFTMGYQRALEGLRVFIRDIEKQEMPDTWKLHRIFGYAETIEANTERHEVSDEEIEKEYDNYRSNNYSNSRMEVWVAGYRAALERMK